VGTLGARSSGPVADAPPLDSEGPVGAEGDSTTGPDCSGALEAPAAEEPESVGPDDAEPESLDPPDDGSKPIDPDEDEPESLDPVDVDEPESLDDPESLGAMGNGGEAAAVRAPEPSPSRLASTPHVTAMPASNRFVFTVDSLRSLVSRPGGRRRPRCATARIG
jgi:hypothetical protein